MGQLVRFAMRWEIWADTVSSSSPELMRWEEAVGVEELVGGKEATRPPKSVLLEVGEGVARVGVPIQM